MIFFLEEALQSHAAVLAALSMQSNDDIAVLTRRLRFDYHIIAIANMVLNHRATLHNQSVSVLCLKQLMAGIQSFSSVRENVERLTGGDRTHHRNAFRLFG